MFLVVPGAIPAGDLEPIASAFWREHRANPDARHPGQSGFSLATWTHLCRPLNELAVMASQFADSSVELRLDKSSCRRQMPDGTARLALHQDMDAIGTDNIGRQSCVMWLPLVDIDDVTPSLEICPIDFGGFFKHKWTDNSYSVLDADPDFPLVTVSRIKVGDVIVMKSTTIHGTSVKPWHTKERLSLDLRFLG